MRIAERTGGNPFFIEEVVDAGTGTVVATGLADRDEALRVVRGWERLSQSLENGLDGHVRVH